MRSLERVWLPILAVWAQMVRYNDRPGLWEGTVELFADIWPEYNRQGPILNRYWGQLYVFPEWQFFLCDLGTGEVLAEGQTVPVAWDGSDTGLGPGIDAAIEAGFQLRTAGGQPDCVCALAAEIPARYRGRRLSSVLLQAMSGLAREAGLNRLIAPVRPSLKDRYPTIPLERYARWTRPDVSPFDPWIRVHTRMGARIGPVIPRSLHITGTVQEWQSWTQMQFPETGDYVFPAGLTTVHIDRERDLGEYWEPNIWLIHALRPAT